MAFQIITGRIRFAAGVRPRLEFEESKSNSGPRLDKLMEFLEKATGPKINRMISIGLAVSNVPFNFYPASRSVERRDIPTDRVQLHGTSK